MSGLLALLDDVAAIAKVAAASIDDIASQAAKAGSKAAGVVIDDAAVAPKYVTGFDAARELPIIWRIARGSMINKMVFLLPAALLMATFAPWLVAPLLILGGTYLCFEGAEKVLHVLLPHGETHEAVVVGDKAALEEAKIKGAIKTDFILSAEIMTISLASIETDIFWLQATTLAVVGIMITIVVYGVVALIVKMDDVGLWMTRVGRLAATRALGRAIVRFMPFLLKALAFIGTVAMLWVGGSIIVHSLHEMGWHAPYDLVHGIAHGLGQGNAAMEWIVTAALDFVLGLIWGGIIAAAFTKLVAPMLGKEAH